MRVLAVDPGKMTGLCVWEDGEIEACAKPYDEALEWCVTGISTHFDLVVCEDFVISERTTKMSSAGWRRGVELEFIGVLRWFCRHADVEFVLQTPADAKGFSTDAKLKRYGWWTKGLDHPRDASRHMMLALAKRRLINPADLVG